MKRLWGWLTSPKGAEVVTMVATIVMASFVVMTYRYNEKMDRPWVLPFEEVPASPQPATGDPGLRCDVEKLALCTVISNTGKSPALNIEVTNRLFRGRPPRTLDRKAFEDHLNTPGTEYAGLLGTNVSLKLGVGRSTVAADVLKSLDEREEVYALFRLFYEDTLGRKHRTYFYNCYTPAHGDWGVCGDSFAD